MMLTTDKEEKIYKFQRKLGDVGEDPNKSYAVLHELFDTKDGDIVREVLLGSETPSVSQIVWSLTSPSVVNRYTKVNGCDIILDLLTKLGDSSVWKPCNDTCLLRELYSLTIQDKHGGQTDDLSRFVRLLSLIPTYMINKSLVQNAVVRPMVRIVSKACKDPVTYRNNLVQHIVYNVEDPTPILRVLSGFESFEMCLTAKNTNGVTPLRAALQMNRSVKCIKFLLSSDRGAFALDMGGDESTLTPFQLMVKSKDSALHVLAVDRARKIHSHQVRKESILAKIEEQNRT